MRGKTFISGLILIFLGTGLFYVYDSYIKPEKEAQILLNQAKIILEREDTESANQAIDTLTILLAKYPNFKNTAEAQYLLANSYEKVGMHRLAYLKYTYLIKNYSTLTEQLKRESLLRIAHIKVMKEETSDAKKELFQLLNTYSGEKDHIFRSDVYAELGHIFLKHQNYSAAEKYFLTSLNENADNEEAILGLARVYKKSGRELKAYQTYDKFLKYYGSLSPYFLDVKQSYCKQLYRSALQAYRDQNYNLAKKYFNHFLQAFPDSKKVENSLYWLGECFYSQKQYEIANKYFNRVLENEFYQKDEDARIKKGYCYFMQKKYQAAAHEFQVYLRDYAKGKYVTVAQKWKETATQEIISKRKNEILAKQNLAEEAKQNEEPEESNEDENENDNDTSRVIESIPEPERYLEPQNVISSETTVTENSYSNFVVDKEVVGNAVLKNIELENVAEL